MSMQNRFQVRPGAPLSLCVILLCLWVLTGCNSDDPALAPSGVPQTPEDPFSLEVTVGGASAGCKTFEPAQLGGGTSPDQDCIEYEYTGDSTLRIKHVNTCFNCCTGAFEVDIRVDSNQVLMVERELLDIYCWCLCPFDIEYEFDLLPPGIYTIRVEEPYVGESWHGRGDPLLFTADLRNPTTGSFCVQRDYYPWDQ